jgi:hypothetical protein
VVGSAEEASPFVRIVGAAWLLMGQRTVSEARIFAGRTSAGAGAGAAGEMPPAVSIVGLRRRVRQQRERTAGRVWPDLSLSVDVAPFWRQQACGPQWSQRKPLFITGFERAALPDKATVDAVSTGLSRLRRSLYA